MAITNQSTHKECGKGRACMNQDPPTLLWEMEVGNSHHGRQWGQSWKSKNRAITWPGNPTPGPVGQGKSQFEKTPVPWSSLQHHRQQQANSSSLDRRPEKTTWSVCTMEQDSARKMNYWPWQPHGWTWRWSCWLKQVRQGTTELLWHLLEVESKTWYKCTHLWNRLKDYGKKLMFPKG